VSAADLSFDLPGGGRVLFTERRHGNLSSVAGERAEQAADARRALCAQIGVRALASGHQVHGAHVRWVDELPRGGQPRAGEDDADGQATMLSDVGAMVLSADCIPVALGADGAVAMIHAGWRGLAAGVLEVGVGLLRERGHGGERLTAIVGPCAGVCCYEVGPEVQRALGVQQSAARRIDLRAIAHQRLAAAGVAEVRDAQACTICDERFFSHRREGARAGRQAGVAWLS
jgi:YfiH family protein